MNPRFHGVLNSSESCLLTLKSSPFKKKFISRSSDKTIKFIRIAPGRLKSWDLISFECALCRSHSLRNCRNVLHSWKCFPLPQRIYCSSKGWKTSSSHSKRDSNNEQGLEGEMRTWRWVMGQVSSYNPLPQTLAKSGSCNQMEECHVFLILPPFIQGQGHIP